eukprot:scaffold39519_cov59-Attheya_sp.AAC.3
MIASNFGKSAKNFHEHINLEGASCLRDCCSSKAGRTAVLVNSTMRQRCRQSHEGSSLRWRQRSDYPTVLAHLDE